MKAPPPHQPVVIREVEHTACDLSTLPHPDVPFPAELTSG